MAGFGPETSDECNPDPVAGASPSSADVQTVCPRPPLEPFTEVGVSIHYDAPAGAPPLGVVGAFVGGEKTQWPDLNPGESVSVVLNPLGEPAELTLLFELEGQQHTWEGPRPTLAGHSIAVTIHPDASVSERHCKLPCTLGG
jgi:hypothetical protein